MGELGESLESGRKWAGKDMSAAFWWHRKAAGLWHPPAMSNQVNTSGMAAR
jgi:hypothetical protein